MAGQVCNKVDVRLQEAAKARTLVIGGGAGEGRQYACMGRYRLLVGKEVNGRGVWEQEVAQELIKTRSRFPTFDPATEGENEEGGEEEEEEHPRCYLYHAIYDGGDWQSVAWWIGKREAMETGEAWGWMQMASDALTPVKAVEAWQVWVGEEGGEGEWVSDPAVRVTMGVEEEEQKGQQQHSTNGSNGSITASSGVPPPKETFARSAKAALQTI
jgi:hypothetical protein